MASKNMKKFYVVWVGKKPVPLFALVAFLGKLTRLLRRVGLASLPTLTHHLPAKATRFVPYPLQKTKMFITKGLADSKLLGHASFTTTMIYLHCRRALRCRSYQQPIVEGSARNYAPSITARYHGGWSDGRRGDYMLRCHELLKSSHPQPI